MKTFTKKSVLQKILIALMIVVTLTCSIPKPVHAVGGIITSAITALVTTLLDGVQSLLERSMLGETSDLLKNINDTSTYSVADSTGYTVTVNESDLDGALWGWDAVNIPVINYTPEEIFSNRVPALDINFINPSIKTGNESIDEERNVAIKLQPVISSWYIALRTLAIVGLLSVLVYLGIRMILSGVAADRAKYKKMIMDWVIAMCLIFALHYIMSLALTAVEVVTSMIASPDGGTVNVHVLNDESEIAYSFKGNLMSYVRFMVQQTDIIRGITFLALYLMLIIYSVRFTWTYLKRVVNMAFLTLIAPIVCLTYPIDKVSDGKAQAFDMWIKEFVFNALIQPLHLLLYIVLLGSATELAISNPLYAIVALGFIFAAEKLLKQMFGFGKAGGGTVGSLAGAVGVSNLASQAIIGLAKGAGGKNGAGNGKVRTNDSPQRDGKNKGANKGFNSFDQSNNQGIAQLDTPPTNEGVPEENNNVPPPGDNNNVPPPGDNNNVPPPGDNNNVPMIDGNGNELQSDENDDAAMEASITEQINKEKAESMIEKPEAYWNNRRAELRAEKKATQEQPQPVGTPKVQESLKELGREPEKPETWKTIRDRDRQQKYEEKKQQRIDAAEQQAKNRLSGRNFLEEESRKRKINAYKTWRGIKAAAPTVAYKAARGTLKTAARVAAAGALGVTAGVIGATTGDADKAMQMTLGAAGVGLATGDNVFEGTIGKVMQDTSIKDSYGAGKYGSSIDARNEWADKAYLKSDEHKEEYEKYFKQGNLKMSKKDFDEATKSYREVGITNKKDIRKALILEQQYKKNGANPQDVRGKVQNIVQTYDGVDKRAVYGNEKATEAALKNIESQLSNVKDAKQKRAVANEILQGYRDWYNVG